VHTTDCNGVANDNRLFVALSLSGVGIVRPPQEIIL